MTPSGLKCITYSIVSYKTIYEPRLLSHINKYAIPMYDQFRSICQATLEYNNQYIQ